MEKVWFRDNEEAQEYDDPRYTLDEDAFRMCVMIKAKSNQGRKDFIERMIREWSATMRETLWKCMKKNSKAVTMQEFAMYNALYPEERFYSYKSLLVNDK